MTKEYYDLWGRGLVVVHRVSSSFVFQWERMDCSVHYPGSRLCGIWLGPSERAEQPASEALFPFFYFLFFLCRL